MGGAMPMPAAPAPQPSSTIDLARLREMWESTTPPQPVYPKWFRQPKRPNAQAVSELALSRFDELAEWRMAVRHDLLVLRNAVEGVFEMDREDYFAHKLDKWSSPALVDEFNLAVSWLSGLNRRFTKPSVDEQYAYETRKVELAAKWLYETERMQTSDELEMDRSILEPKLLLAYGRIATRRVLNRYAEPYNSPFKRDYIDPAQLAYIKDGHGISEIFRVYSARAEDLQADYGDFSEATRKKLADLYGTVEDETEFTNVVEYWDRWYRCVTVGGVEIIPVTEHKYGEVPYTIGLGPLGEPTLTTLPEQGGGAALNRETMRENAKYKSVGFIRFMKKQHAQYEAYMKRVLYGVQKDLNPPTVRYRSLTAAMNPSPGMDSSPGVENEAMYGEEKIENFPYPPPSQFNQGIYLDAIMRDRQTGRAPLAAYGVFDQSNISGTASRMGLSAGQHLWKPWGSSLDRFTERDLSKAFRLWQRLGHTVEYATPQRRPFVVPNQRPMKGEPGSFELDRQCLDRVGPAIVVRSDAQDTSDWVTRAQAAKLMSELGMPKNEVFDKLFSITYDQQAQEEWFEEQALAVAMQNPKFFELVIAPTMFAAELNEAQGDEDRTMLLQTLLKGWMQVVVQPAMLEQQAQMGQMQQQMLQQGGMTAPTSEQSFSDQGRGPGSVSGEQGGPQGPTGPRSQGAG